MPLSQFLDGQNWVGLLGTSCLLKRYKKMAGFMPGSRRLDSGQRHSFSTTLTIVLLAATLIDRNFPTYLKYLFSARLSCGFMKQYFI